MSTPARSLVRSALTGTLALTVGAALLAPAATAQAPYAEPPASIVKILDAAPLPWVSTSPTGEHMMLMERENLPPISEMAQPMLRLAGRRLVLELVPDRQLVSPELRS